jgi:hypothetical protein
MSTGGSSATTSYRWRSRGNSSAAIDTPLGELRQRAADLLDRLGALQRDVVEPLPRLCERDARAEEPADAHVAAAFAVT